MTLTLGNTVRDPRGASYVVEGLLGKGGFGAVYAVRDRRIKNNLIAGSFEVLDPGKQPTGESGLWNAAPNS